MNPLFETQTRTKIEETKFWKKNFCDSTTNQIVTIAKKPYKSKL